MPYHIQRKFGNRSCKESYLAFPPVADALRENKMFRKKAVYSFFCRKVLYSDKP